MDLKGKSKQLSYWLRHKPEAIGLKLDRAGWAGIDELISKAARHGFSYTRQDIERLARPMDKLRFALSDDGARIRAVHGHSISQVNLGYEPKEPPRILYHGTAERFLASINKIGIQAGERQYVHLSQDKKSALGVGSRHGRPILLKIDAQGMRKQGCSFYLSENGIWLTPRVPVGFFTLEQVDAGE